MKKANRKKINRKISCLGPVTEYIYSLDVEDLEAVAFSSSQRLKKYLCEECKGRYGFPRIHFVMSKSENMPYLDKIFCSAKCFLKWVAENSEKLDEDMDSLRAIINDEEKNGKQ